MPQRSPETSPEPSSLGLNSPAPMSLGPRLLQARFPHTVASLRLLETHGSWVLLTGDWAYKVKKPVRFEFLDYSTQERRLKCCRRELELNRVWAPQLYQAVVPIFATGDALRIGDAGEQPADGERLVDHAVQMRQFDQGALVAQRLKTNSLPAEAMDRLASDLAHLHARTAAVDDRPEVVQQGAVAPALENLAYLRTQATADDHAREQLERLTRWTEQTAAALLPQMQRRAAAGKVRNCHGDLHLENLLYLGDRFVPFDGIEFSDALRQVDVLSELAFPAMQLHDLGYPQHAHRLVNHYIEVTDDYAGLALLPFFLVYRALVRAKVDRLCQPQAADEAAALPLSPQAHHYLELAQRWIARPQPQLWITHGLSGSGKSVSALQLVQRAGFIRVRSDVVRKRLAGLEPLARPSAAQLPLIYGEAMTQRTYDRLLASAQQVIEAGFSVIVDAAFLQSAQRVPFRELARRCGVPFRILHCEAPAEELRRRIQGRRDDPSDASLAVLEQQLRGAEPLGAEERPAVVDQQQIAQVAPAFDQA